MVPLDLLDRYVNAGTSGDRAGVFFIAAAFALAQVGTNISANSISAGTDGSALLPRFVNIRRGGFICAAIAFCVCPWNFFTSSSNFTTYLSAYAVFCHLSQVLLLPIIVLSDVVISMCSICIQMVLSTTIHTTSLVLTGEVMLLISVVSYQMLLVLQVLVVIKFQLVQPMSITFHFSQVTLVLSVFTVH